MSELSMCTCGHEQSAHAFQITDGVAVEGHGPCVAAATCECARFTWVEAECEHSVEWQRCRYCNPDWEPSDDDLMNRPGVEGGVGYPLGPEPMHEHDWRL